MPEGRSRMRRTLHWIRCHRMWTAGIVLLAIVILLNGLAYRHARSMTHFLPAGDGPKKKLEEYTTSEKIWVLLNGLPIHRPQQDSSPANLGLAYETRTVPGAIGNL